MSGAGAAGLIDIFDLDVTDGGAQQRRWVEPASSLQKIELPNSLWKYETL